VGSKDYIRKKQIAINRENKPSAATSEKEPNESAVTGKDGSSSVLAAESSLPAELSFSGRAQVSGSNETHSKELNDGVAKNNESSSTGFPSITQFSPHVNHLVEAYDAKKVDKGCIRFHFTVSSPYSVPSIDCGHYVKSKRKWWCEVLHDTFANKERVLPGNVIFGVSPGDWADPEQHGYDCFGNSGPGGKFAITNFLEIRRMSENRTFPSLPWEERHKIPVWRGSLWTNAHVQVANESTVLEQVIRNGRKTKIVPTSIQG
jgi:hypothetical protein